MVILRTPEAAKKIGMSTAFLEQQRCKGTGPVYIKIGRTVAYREADLDAWVNSLARQSTSQPAQPAQAAA